MKSTKRGIFGVILTLTLCLSIIPVQAANPTDTAAVSRAAFASALWDHEGNPTVNYALTFRMCQVRVGKISIQQRILF